MPSERLAKNGDPRRAEPKQTSQKRARKPVSKLDPAMRHSAGGPPVKAPALERSTENAGPRQAKASTGREL